MENQMHVLRHDNVGPQVEPALAAAVLQRVD